MLRDPFTGAEIDEGMEDFYEQQFQVIVRHEDPAAGYQLARDISQVLNVRRLARDDMFIVMMNPMTLPISYPKGDADDVETAVRIHVAFGELAS